MMSDRKASMARVLVPKNWRLLFMLLFVSIGVYMCLEIITKKKPLSLHIPIIHFNTVALQPEGKGLAVVDVPVVDIVVEPKVKPSNPPTILMWIPTYHTRNWQIPATKVCGGGCEITNDRSRIEDSDALVFYMKGTNGEDVPKTQRNLEQLYVWWSHESPATVNHYWHKALTEHNNFFNLTMHFRSDSDLIGAFIPHSARDWYLYQIGRGADAMEPKLSPHTTEAEFDEMFERLYQMKTGDATWVVSDCDIVRGANKRLGFGRSVGEHFPVDILGKCGTKELPMSNKAVFDTIQRYRFYFAFENTENCREYITEKFWYNSLYAASIPVVWGTSVDSYQALAPPGSYIHAQDFDNDPVKLAEHLHKVNNDKELYKDYFRWWYTMPGFYPIYNFREPEDPEDITIDDVFDYEINGFCHLCHVLNNREKLKVPSIVPDLREHFYGYEKSECYT